MEKCDFVQFVDALSGWVEFGQSRVEAKQGMSSCMKAYHPFEQPLIQITGESREMTNHYLKSPPSRTIILLLFLLRFSFVLIAMLTRGTCREGLQQLKTGLSSASGTYLCTIATNVSCVSFCTLGICLLALMLDRKAMVVGQWKEKESMFHLFKAKLLPPLHHLKWKNVGVGGIFFFRKKFFGVW